MRKPQSPPAFDHLFQQAAKSGRLGRIMTAATRSLPRSDYRYLHWDEWRHRPAPADFSHEEWWLATKLFRTPGLRPVPLRDCGGREFRYSVPDRVAELLHAIDRGAGNLADAAILVGEPALIVNPQTRNAYVLRSLIEEAFTSSRLEGAVTTREIARQLALGGRTPRSESERMVLNNYRTMQRILELRGQALDQETVCELHRSVTEGTLKDPAAAGRFRRPEEPVDSVNTATGEGVHVPPPAAELAQRMAAMCAFANGGNTPEEGFLHPVVRAILLHFWLAYDHPFTDGNGRTARALFYWAMLRSGFVLFEFVSISSVLLRAPAQYYRAFLFSETDDNDLTYFLLHQAGVVQRALQDLRGYLQQKAGAVREAERLARDFAELNFRQRALLADALRHPGRTYTVQGHRSDYQLGYDTARTDLLEMQRLGLLTLRREGRQMIFELAPDASAKLATDRKAATLRD